MAMAMAMAIIPAATATATPTISRSITACPIHLRKGASNLSCSTRPHLLGMRAALLHRPHCPRSSSYGGGEVIEAEFTPVVEQEPEAPTIQEDPAPAPAPAPAQEQAGNGYYDRNQQYDQSQGQYYEQGDPSQAQYAMEGGGGEDRAEFEMEGGDYDPQQDEFDEQQYYEGYDQSQYQQYDPSQQQQQQQQSPYAAENAEAAPPKEPPPHYDNFGKVMKFIALGRAMQFKLDSQKDFEMFLDKCSAYGVMIPENPSDIKRNLCELDPKQTWIVVDSRAVLKFAKKLALEEAERNKDDYPPGFVENMLNRDKYGRYKSDDDY